MTYHYVVIMCYFISSLKLPNHNDNMSLFVHKIMQNICTHRTTQYISNDPWFVSTKAAKTTRSNKLSDTHLLQGLNFLELDKTPKVLRSHERQWIFCYSAFPHVWIHSPNKNVRTLYQDYIGKQASKLILKCINNSLRKLS